MYEYVKILAEFIGHYEYFINFVFSEYSDKSKYL